MDFDLFNSADLMICLVKQILCCKRMCYQTLENRSTHTYVLVHEYYLVLKTDTCVVLHSDSYSVLWLNDWCLNLCQIQATVEVVHTERKRYVPFYGQHCESIPCNCWFVWVSTVIDMGARTILGQAFGSFIISSPTLDCSHWLEFVYKQNADVIL